MPLGIPISRQSGGAWATTGGPDSTRDLMAMTQQDVSWAQQMDMFYANLEQAEGQFEETMTERTRQYDLTRGDILSDRATEQENWLKQFGLSEEQWEERKESIDLDQLLRQQDVDKGAIMLRRLEDAETNRTSGGMGGRGFARRDSTGIGFVGARPKTFFGAPSTPSNPNFRPPTLSSGSRRLRGPGGSALERWGGVDPSGGRGGGVRIRRPGQSLSDRMAGFSAIGGLEDLIRREKGADPWWVGLNQRENPETIGPGHYEPECIERDAEGNCIAWG